MTGIASKVDTMAQQEIARRYAKEGYVIFRDVLDPELIAEADRHVDWLLEQNPDRRPEDLGHELARSDPFWVRLISDDRLLDLAEIFLGPDIALFATHYICKPPRTGRRVSWHQDGAFWPIEPMEVVTMWLAITDSNPENGCLRVVPGSHKSRLAEMREATEDNVLPAEIALDVDEADAVDLILSPGDVSVHHPAIHHASEPNGSDRWRRGLTIRYIPTSTRILEPEAASPFLLRGSPRGDHNSYLPFPAYVPGAHMSFQGADHWPPQR